MKRLLALGLLFTGFTLLMFGALFILAAIVPLSSKATPGSKWPVIAIGLAMVIAGWGLRRSGLSQWRGATEGRKAQP